MSGAVSPSVGRLLRLLVGCYPRPWREARQAEMLWMLEQEARTRGVSWGLACDVAGHGLEARSELWLKWLPVAVRFRISLIASATLAVLSALLLVMVERGSPTLAAPLLVGWVVAFALVLARRGGAARVITVLCTVAVALLPVLSYLTGGDQRLLLRPPLFVLGPLGLLSLLSCLATVRLSRKQRRTGLVVAVSAALVFGAQLYVWARSAHRGFVPGWYRDSLDMSILAFTVQISVALGLVVVAVSPSRRQWLLPMSTVATALLLFYDPAEPIPALLVLAACWMAPALVLHIGHSSSTTRDLGAPVQGL